MREFRDTSAAMAYRRFGDGEFCVRLRMTYSASYWVIKTDSYGHVYPVEITADEMYFNRLFSGDVPDPALFRVVG